MNSKESIKGNLRAVIFQILIEKGESYAYEMIQIAKEKTNNGILISEGALYPVLHKMEAEELLTSKIKKIENRKRKYYSLTEEGKKESLVQIQNIKEFIRQLEMIFNPGFKTSLK